MNTKIKSELPYDSRKIGNRLIQISNQNGKAMSILRLIKLTYMAHGWTLAITDEPLVNEYVQAWKYGPVIPTVYFSFRPIGVYDLKTYHFVKDTEIDSATDDILDMVYDMYKDASAYQLSALTHIPGGPWHRAYKPNELGTIIPNEWITEHFKNKLKRAQYAEINA